MAEKKAKKDVRFTNSQAKSPKKEQEELVKQAKHLFLDLSIDPSTSSIGVAK